MSRVLFLDEADAERAPLACALARHHFSDRAAFGSAGRSPRPLAAWVQEVLAARAIDATQLGGQGLETIQPDGPRLVVDLLEPAPPLPFAVQRRHWTIPPGDPEAQVAAITQRLAADALLVAPTWHFDFTDGADGRRIATLREAGITRSVRAPVKGPPALLARVFSLYEAFPGAEYGRLQRAAQVQGPVSVTVHPTEAARIDLYGRKP